MTWIRPPFHTTLHFIRSTLPYTTSLRAILILPSWKCVGLPSCLSFSVSVSKFCMHFSNLPHTPHARPSHLLCITTATTARFMNLPIMQIIPASRQIMRVRQLYEKAALCYVTPCSLDDSTGDISSVDGSMALLTHVSRNKPDYTASQWCFWHPLRPSDQQKAGVRSASMQLISWPTNSRGTSGQCHGASVAQCHVHTARTEPHQLVRAVLIRQLNRHNCQTDGLALGCPILCRVRSQSYGTAHRNYLSHLSWTLS